LRTGSWRQLNDALDHPRELEVGPGL